MTEEDKYKIPLFDSTNYHAWKFGMECYVGWSWPSTSNWKEVKTWRGYRGTTKEDAIMKRIVQKTKEDKACKRKIVSKVADIHLEYLQGQSTAFDMWESLGNGFERHSLASQHRLKNQLEMLKANPNHE